MKRGKINVRHFVNDRSPIYSQKAGQYFKVWVRVNLKKQSTIFESKLVQDAFLIDGLSKPDKLTQKRIEQERAAIENLLLVSNVFENDGFDIKFLKTYYEKTELNTFRVLDERIKWEFETQLRYSPLNPMDYLLNWTRPMANIVRELHLMKGEFKSEESKILLDKFAGVVNEQSLIESFLSNDSNYLSEQFTVLFNEVEWGKLLDFCSGLEHGSLFVRILTDARIEFAEDIVKSISRSEWLRSFAGEGLLLKSVSQLR